MAETVLKALSDEEKKFLASGYEVLKDIESLKRFKDLKIRELELKKQDLLSQKKEIKALVTAESDKVYRHGVFVILGILWKVSADNVVNDVGKYFTEGGKLSEAGAAGVSAFFKAKKRNFEIKPENIEKKIDKNTYKQRAKVATEKKQIAESEAAYWTLCEKIKDANDPQISEAIKLEIKLGLKKSILDKIQKKEKKPVEKKPETKKQ